MSKQIIHTKQAMRYARHILLSGFDLDKQEQLINSKVFVVGVGGLGCAAAQYLAASGVGHISLVDNDIVEISNLQRQVLYTENDIGRLKVDSAKEHLQAINSEINIRTFNSRLTYDALQQEIAQHDLVLDCSDNLETRNQLNQICYTRQKPLVSGAAIRMEGQVFCVLPHLSSACYQCISQFFSEQELSCVEAGVLSPVVGVIGAMQAVEAIKVLCDYGKMTINSLLIYDAMMSSWEQFTVAKNPNCPICNVNNA